MDCQVECTNELMLVYIIFGKLSKIWGESIVTAKFPDGAELSNDSFKHTSDVSRSN
jgi:hypothetical protein